MIRDVEPFKFLLKIFHVFGFNNKTISTFHKCCCCFIYIFLFSYWSLTFLSLLQVHNIEEFSERLLFVPALLGTCLKALNMITKYRELDKLVDNLDDSFGVEKLANGIKSAVLLVKTIFTLYSLVYFAGTISSFATQTLVVKMFMINVPGYEYQINWCYLIIQNVGSLFNIFLTLFVNSLPVCLMMLIADFIQNLNEKIKQLKPSNKSMRVDFIKLINQYQQQKR